MRRAQVAVVGGGPAGLSAATTAARAGAQVILLDENHKLGGQLRYRLTESPGFDNLPRLGTSLIAEARDAGIDLHAGAVVWGLFPGSILAVTEPDNAYHLQADQIILATGSTDLPFTFPGSSSPGVMTSRAIQIILHIHRVLPGRRFAVIGTGPEAEEVSRDIELAGGQVVARVDPEHGISAMADDIDITIIAVGRQPDCELALMVECEAGYATNLGGHVPLRDQNLRSSVPGIIVAGDAGGVCDVATAIAEGQFAGLSAAAALGLLTNDALAGARTTYISATGDRAATAATLIPVPTHV
jgi:thioredoxin reductase